MKKAVFLGDDDELIKHEKDSADLTMSRIPISSRGTDAAHLSGVEESKERLDADENEEDGLKKDSKDSHMSEIVVKTKTMKR